MKINIEKNVVTITSTTGPEFNYLLDTYKDFVSPTGKDMIYTGYEWVKDPSPSPKKRKRYLHTKSCSICAKNVKGNAAMSMHMKMHRRIDSESVNESI